MANKTRKSIGLEEETGIDISAVVGKKSRPTRPQQETIVKAGEKYGFVNRDPAKQKARKRSPYVIQKNLRLRLGMDNLLHHLAERTETNSEQVTFELAILALINQEGYEDLREEYNKLVAD